MAIFDSYVKKIMYQIYAAENWIYSAIKNKLHFYQTYQVFMYRIGDFGLSIPWIFVSRYQSINPWRLNGIDDLYRKHFQMYLMKIIIFWLKFHWSVFLIGHMTIIHHWFREWLIIIHQASKCQTKSVKLSCISTINNQCNLGNLI